MKKLKHILLVMVCVCAVSTSQAQQAYQFSQYLQNLYLLNTATAGLHDYTELNTSFRSQWVGIENSPQTIYASLTHPLGKRLDVEPKKGSVRISSPSVYNNTRNKSYHAIGGYVVRDAFGPYSMNIATLSYTYHLPIAKKVSLSFSPNIGMSQTSFNQNKAQVELEGDPTYDNYAGLQGSTTKMDMNLAFWLSHPKYFAGYSTNQLLGDRLVLSDQISLTELKAHHNLIAGFHKRLNRNVELTPSVMMRYEIDAPFNADLNLMIDFQERLWVGAAYRTNRTIVGMVGANISSTIRLGYSFDISLTSLQLQNVGSHELILGINLFNKEKAVF